jgi:hypothetical protein
MRVRLLLSVLMTLVGASLSMPAAAVGQTFAYAEECITNVNNATIHIPADAAPTLPDGTPVETGDTLAVYTAAGTCAGYGVWGEGGGVTLAAAGSDSVDASEDGYLASDSLKFEVFDVSAEQETQIESGTVFASCDSLGVPVCAEGTYGDGTFHQVADFQAGSDSSVTRTLTLAEGWNFISIPVQSDLSFGTLLSECSSGFFHTPEEGYMSIAESDSLPVGEGVAVQCQANTTSVTGQLASPKIEVEAGWNLIGSLEDTVSVDAITTAPSGIVVSNFFETTPGGYQIASELQPGKGYWVNIAEAGTLDVSGSGTSAPLASTAQTASSGMGDATRLSFVDANGNQSALLLKDGLTPEQRARFELPPVPPGEVFDVRFAGGLRVASFSSSDEPGRSSEKRRVQLQGVAFPIEVRLETSDDDRRFDLLAGEKEFTLSDEQASVQIQQSAGRFAIAAAPNPNKFRLGKAYPNPIQNKATLEYALAKKAEVSIAVYDMLGRQVRRLVDKERKTGLYQTQVDASMLASGKYFVRMRAGSFQKTRQLTVVR